MNLRETILSLALTLATAAAVAMPASASAAPTCRDIFSGSVASRARLVFASPVEEFRSALAQLRAPPFSADRFEVAATSYRANEPATWTKPQSREAKLAMVQVIAEKSGYDPLALETLIQNSAASPRAFANLSKSLGKIDPVKGFSAIQIESIFVKAYRFSHSDPGTLANLKNLGMNAIERELIRQWADKELGTHSFEEAISRMGFLRDPSVKERFVARLRSTPNLIANINVAALGLFQYAMVGSVITAPSYSKLLKTKISPELREAVLRDGFDASYPILKTHYGHLAKFDNRFYWARRAVTTALMGVFLMNMYPVVMQNILPASYPTENHGSLQLTKDVIEYYSHVAKKLYEHEFGEKKIETTVKKSIVSDKDALQLNDGAPISTDPDPVPIKIVTPPKTLQEEHKAMQQMEEAIEVTAPESGEDAKELKDLIKALDEEF